MSSHSGFRGAGLESYLEPYENEDSNRILTRPELTRSPKPLS